MKPSEIAFRQQMRPGKRYTSGDRIRASIGRAIKRGRISLEAGARCNANWPDLLASRPKPVVWLIVAAGELAYAAQLRKQKNYSLAKVILRNTHSMIHTLAKQA